MAKKSVPPRVTRALAFTREDPDGRRKHWAVEQPEYFCNVCVFGADYAAQLMRL